MTNPNTPTLPKEHRLTYEDAEHLAQLISHYRPDWHKPGIVKAIEAHVSTTRPLDLTQAIITAARNSANRTPAVLHHPGPHWAHTTQDIDPKAEEATGAEPCPIPEHARIGKLKANCPECRKTFDFPEQISRTVFEQLDPAVQGILASKPYVRIVEG